MKTYRPNTGTMNMYDKHGNFLQVITTDGERFVTLSDYRKMVSDLNPEIGVIFPDKSERHDVSKDIVDTNHKDYMG